MALEAEKEKFFTVIYRCGRKHPQQKKVSHKTYENDIKYRLFIIYQRCHYCRFESIFGDVRK